MLTAAEGFEGSVGLLIFQVSDGLAVYVCEKLLNVLFVLVRVLIVALGVRRTAAGSSALAHNAAVFKLFAVISRVINMLAIALCLL